LSGRASVELTDWRESIAARRALVITFVSNAAIEGILFEAQISQFKHQISYPTLSDKDKNLVVMLSQARVISRGWGRVPDKMKTDFLDGKTPYSTVYKELV
jgi:hypothetical protein